MNLGFAHFRLTLSPFFFLRKLMHPIHGGLIVDRQTFHYVVSGGNKFEVVSKSYSFSHFLLLNFSPKA